MLDAQEPAIILECTDDGALDAGAAGEFCLTYDEAAQAAFTEAISIAGAHLGAEMASLYNTFRHYTTTRRYYTTEYSTSVKM